MWHVIKAVAVIVALMLAGCIEDLATGLGGSCTESCDLEQMCEDGSIIKRERLEGVPRGACYSWKSESDGTSIMSGCRWLVENRKNSCDKDGDGRRDDEHPTVIVGVGAAAGTGDHWDEPEWFDRGAAGSDNH